jgi:hypothetical protein
MDGREWKAAWFSTSGGARFTTPRQMDIAAEQMRRFGLTVKTGG